jgi:hypothetical protein
MKAMLGGGVITLLPWVEPSRAAPSAEPAQIIISAAGVLVILARLWLVHRTQMKIVEKASEIQSADVADALQAVAEGEKRAKRTRTAVGGHRRRK